MSDGGYIVLARAVFEHAMFAREEFSDLHAWAWMINAAAWKPTQFRRGNRMVTLARGELSFSERFLAERFRWSKSSVRRFLNVLKNESMIDLKTDHESTQITICNYDKYQLGRTTEWSSGGPQSEPRADHARTKEEEVIKKKNTKKDYIGAIATAMPPDAGKIFDDQFWSAYPKREGANPKAPARKAFVTAVKNGNSPATIVAGVQRYSADLNRSSKVGTQFVAQAVTWLNQKRWEDYPDEPAANTAPRPPDPSMASHEELKRKYGAKNERGAAKEGSGLRPEGRSPCSEATPTRPQEPTDDPSGDPGVGGMGNLFSRLPRVLSVGDEARDARVSCSEGWGGDDSSYSVARMVR